MDTDFKRLGKTDVAVLQSVAEDVFDHPIELERAERFLADHRNVLIVAIEHNQVIGQIAGVVHQHIDAPADLYIDNLGVTPSRQRCGIARRLIALMLEAGHQHGAKTAWVAVESDNAAAHGLYDNTGAKALPITMFSYS